MKSRRYFWIVVLSVLSSACGDECRKYSDFSCRQIERAEYKVFFYYPSGSERYLGQVHGLQACGAAARGFAESKGLTTNSEWGYVCCMRAKGSECYEKHR